MLQKFGPALVAVATFTAAVTLSAAPSKAPKAMSHSIGAPNEGKLADGYHLEVAPHLRIVPAYAGTDVRWGTRELVELIDRSAREVKKRYPDAILGVGHLSKKGGGEIDHHHSHESGRDADLAFYLTDVAGRPALRERFVTIGVNGIANDGSHLRFDDGRNWALVTALLTDPRAKVTHVFVVSHLRARLLAYGARIGAPIALRNRVAEVLMQPHHALPHDDHFHVRIACPGGSPECVEYPLSAGKANALAKYGSKGKTKLGKPPHKKLVRARATGIVKIEAPLPVEPTSPSLAPKDDS
ncbi:MAG: penicillin-insensitive murein endopeptidase [Myxococcales bacterium]|nr:penicillin-insensitive murein endopeptidase [Myxococcales bacterium]